MLRRSRMAASITIIPRAECDPLVGHSAAKAQVSVEDQKWKSRVKSRGICTREDLSGQRVTVHDIDRPRPRLT
jgi:hypothetical protein